MILTSQISHSSKKCEIRCPESRKILMTHLPYGSGRQTSGERESILNVDKGEEGLKIVKPYGRLIWIAPYSKISITY